MQKESGLFEQLKNIIVFSAYFGEIGCPNEWGFKELEWPGKNCINSDCGKCWKWAIEQMEGGATNNA